MYQGDLRHRLRQVHRGRGCAVYSDGINTIFEKLEGFPSDWKTKCSGVHSGSYANTSVRVFWSTASIRTLQPLKFKKALKLKRTFSDMLDQMPMRLAVIRN